MIYDSEKSDGMKCDVFFLDKDELFKKMLPIWSKLSQRTKEHFASMQGGIVVK